MTEGPATAPARRTCLALGASALLSLPALAWIAGMAQPTSAAEDPSLRAGWPLARPVIPPDPELAEQLAAALDLSRRREFSRLLDAAFPGDLLEDATLRQEAIDRGIFGVDALFAVGDDLFELEFRPQDGLGNGLQGLAPAGSRDAPNLRRVHGGTFGGPDAHSCATCHSKGGPDGAGTQTQNAFLRGDGDATLSADERNPPLLLGLGPIAALAVQISAELQAARDAALAEANRSNEAVEVALSASGVDFGRLIAKPGGVLDTSAVQGVDDDLVIRAFGWKGHQDLRGMIEESFRLHLGILSSNVQQRVRDGLLAAEDFGQGEWDDLDADGVTTELDSGMLTTVFAYLSQLEVPIVRPPQTPVLLDAFARGRALFQRIGCATCHVPELRLRNPLLVTRPTDPDQSDRAAVTIDVAHDGDSPKIAPTNLLEEEFVVELFSDLKRHDMGEQLAAPTIQRGIPPSVFLTRTLWGLAETGPYLHDGRAPTVDEAIRLHGGEAVAARDAYADLDADSQGALRVFLMSLSRTPKLVMP